MAKKELNVDNLSFLSKSSRIYDRWNRHRQNWPAFGWRLVGVWSPHPPWSLSDWLQSGWVKFNLKPILLLRFCDAQLKWLSALALTQQVIHCWRLKRSQLNMWSNRCEAAATGVWTHSGADGRWIFVNACIFCTACSMLLWQPRSKVTCPGGAIHKNCWERETDEREGEGRTKHQTTHM